MFPIQGGQPSEKLYSDSVFSTYLYTGNGSTQTITNGIDLAGKGGLVWTKNRAAADHQLFDTARGALNSLSSNTTALSSPFSNSLTAFNSAGFSLGSSTVTNLSSNNYVSWTFRKAPKFFDVVTYTGNGSAPRALSHALGVTPGMVVIKKTSGTSNWWVTHRSAPNQGAAYPGIGGNLYLDTTDAADAGTNPALSAMDATTFTLSTNQNATLNVSGQTYVAYLFAHDTTTDGIIQCGSFTTTGALLNVTLGWEPQWLMVKRSDNTGNWFMMDAMRGFVTDLATGATYLVANTSAAESSGIAFSPTATGFSTNIGAGSTYIYLAIRRPNKPPTSGTQVYNAIARTGTGSPGTLVTGVGFTPDTVMIRDRTATTYPTAVHDRLRGANKHLYTSATDAEASFTTTVTSLDMDGMTLGAGNGWNASGESLINWFFRRAPGVMDEICYSGTGANKTESHNLKVAPELWLIKSRSGATQWTFGSSLLNNTEKIVMPSVNGRVTDATVWNSTYPTASVISLGTSTDVNNSGATYVGYLWATLAGVSKVGTYTGNGSSQTINMGFAAGARFFMVIRATASTAQDIFIWDSVRGIVAANDPHLSLNTTAAEVTTDDSVDPDASGIIVNQVAATNINVNGAVYLYVAYA